MRLITFYTSVSFLSSAYLMIYQFAVILLLTGTLFNNKIKTESYNFLYVFNTLIVWSYLFSFLAYGAELFIAWYGQNPYEWYAFKEGGRPWKWLSIINLLSSLMALLMFFRKLRISRWFILLFLFSSCGFIYEKVIVFITGLYRDYLPSSWSTYYDPLHSLFVYGIILILLILQYFWAKKKGRLPFPSVFLE